MTDEVQQVNQTTTRAGDTVQRTTEVKNPRQSIMHKANTAERVIWYVAGILLVLLTFRFVLSLLGANTTNGFANFIFSTSKPFVAPFFSLFNYNNYVYGTSRFEVFTLVAIAVYAVIAWGLARLVTINRD